MFGRLLTLLLYISLSWLIPASANEASLLPDTPIGAVLFSGGSSHLAGSTIDLNYAAGKYYLAGSNGVMPTVSRASVKECQGAGGIWISAAVNTGCVGPGNGLLVEEARTNGIRNNTMQGAVVGSPGTSPTNWLATGTTSGVTVSVIGLSTINGLSAITYSVVGTPTSTFGLDFTFDAPLAIPALYGQTWTLSTFISATNQTNVGASTGLQFSQVNSGGSGIGSLYAFGVYPTTTLSRIAFSATTVNPATAALYPSFQFNMQNGLAVNFNMTIAAPQLEQDANITATVASAVMAASGSGGVNGTAVYQVGGGTGTAATLNVTWAAGVMTVNSVASAGAYTAFPTSPATLTYVSGTATGWTGATVTLTPANNAALAFATSPILTTSGALTRAADVVTLAIWPFTTGSIIFIGTPIMPSANPAFQSSAEINDGTFNNRLYMSRASGTPGVSSAVNGAYNATSGYGAVWSSGVSGKLAAAQSLTTTYGVFNNGTQYSVASPSPVPYPRNSLSIGDFGGGAFNGYVQRIAESPLLSFINN